MREPIPHKGAVLTQMQRVLVRAARRASSRRTSSPRDADEIVARVPALARPRATRSRGRAMLVRRTDAGAVRVRRARLPLRLGVGGVPATRHPGRRAAAGRARESERLDPPLFSPATKAETGHDENVTFDRDGRRRWARELADRLRDAELRRLPRRPRPRRRPRDHHRRHQVRVRPRRRDGTLRLIDEVLTPDCSRFWPADRYAPGRTPAQLRQAAAARLPRRRSTAQGGGTARRRRRRCPPRWSRRPAGATSRRSGAHRPRAGGCRVIRTAPEGRLVHRRRVGDRAGAARGAVRLGRLVDRGAVLWTAARDLGRRVLPRSRARRARGRPAGHRAGGRQGRERDRGRRAGVLRRPGASGSRSS